jgi:lipopolysaccharide/colanic/teichoic acid biosynthesis glycosyltransferase
MSSHHQFRGWILAADLLWLTLSMILAWLIRYGSAWRVQPRQTVQAFSITLLGSLLIWSILWSVLELDGFRGGWRFAAVASHLVLAVTIVMVVILSAGYLVRIYVSRLALGYFSIAMLGGFILIRIAARTILHTRYRRGSLRQIVIVGSGPVAREVAARIEHHPEMLCRVVGFLATRDESLEVLTAQSAPDVINLPTCNIVNFLRTQNVDELIFAMPRNGSPEVVELLDHCVKRGIAISVVPQPYELYLSTPELLDLDGLPILRLRHSLWVATNPLWKRVLDLVVSVPLLVPAIPVILGAALVLRIKKGAGFCREQRYGLHGQTFALYRLNSPRRAQGLPRYELIMQHLSVTELPQLFNVLRGDMSLVGPRPEGFESVRHYTDWHRQRLNVKPGITGLAQVHGLREQTPLEDKTRYDLQYILRRSLFQDMSLLLQTMWTLTSRLAQLSSGIKEEPEPIQSQATSNSLTA